MCVQSCPRKHGFCCFFAVATHKKPPAHAGKEGEREREREGKGARRGEVGVTAGADGQAERQTDRPTGKERGKGPEAAMETVK